MDKKKALARVFELAPPEYVRLVIWYGQRPGRDIDLLVILKGDFAFQNFKAELIDINTIGEVWLPLMVKYLDPILTEPVLTGEAIFGAGLEQLKQDITAVTADENSTYYLLECAEIFLGQAKLCRRHRQLADAALTLSFAASYILYAWYYQGHQQAVKFEELKQRTPAGLLTQLLQLSKTGPEQVLARQLAQYFYQIGNFLTEAMLTNTIKVPPW